jgi:hypothetical protein
MTPPQEVESAYEKEQQGDEVAKGSTLPRIGFALPSTGRIQSEPKVEAPRRSGILGAHGRGRDDLPL